MTMGPFRASIFLLLFVTLIFASTAINQSVNIATFNNHGFSSSSTYLRDCIHSYGGVWMIQEHWLGEQQLHQLQQLGVQFVARSGMEDALSAGIYRGRPFGGVGICWSPDLNNSITPLSNFQHKRVVAAEMKANDGDLLLICVYMPFFNASKREQCLVEAIDAISMIEILIENFPNHRVIIGGDLNTELRGQSSFDSLWNELCSKNSLSYCQNITSGPLYTYRHESLNQTKLNDHFVVSDSLISHVSSLRVLDDGDNASDHLPLLMNLSTSTQKDNISEPSHSSRQCTKHWNKISKACKDNYSSTLELLLLQRQDQRNVFGCKNACGCKEASCLVDLQSEYDEIVLCMKNASKLLPKANHGVEKDWWSSTLTQLRDKSVEIQRLWISEGRPRHGPTNDERLRVRAAYKCEIRRAKKAPKQEAWNRLHQAMADHDTGDFWKRWSAIYGKKSANVAPVVAGFSSNVEITGAFQKAFEKNSRPNNPGKVAELDARFQSLYHEFSSSHESNCNCAEYKFSIDDTLDAVFDMKDGKSQDDDNLSAEHFKNGPLILFIKLTSLFNSMLAHGFVPQQFRFGTITPIIKDRCGNASDLNNYRGITISPIVSKIFERILRKHFCDNLSSSSYQFGFKTGKSTSHAIFCLNQTINYYIDHGSQVYCSFLDASKAFDRLIHSGLFIKLIERNAPKVFVDILITWYRGLQCRVKWNNHLGDWFSVTAGVRQGGILSPDFYNLYVDDLIHLLRKSGIGCHIAHIFAAAIFYADDMCILSPSLKGLQTLLNICSSYCIEWDIGLNAKKSKNMHFGKQKQFSFHPTLNGVAVEWVNEWRYLGVTLRAGPRFGCAVKERVKSFYRCLNSILRVEGRSDDMILLQLLETHCVPILTYAIETITVANRDEKRSMRVAYNSIYRKLFGYRYFESVTNLQHSLGRQTWEELVESRSAGFLKRAKLCDADTLVRAFC